MLDLTSRLASVMDPAAADGREPGAAACVVRDGEVVAEHVVGTRDGTVPWTPDTLVMTYSCAKPLAALATLGVVAEGGLGLDQRVAELWPAYGARGKEDTTVRHVLSHAAGVPWWPEVVGAFAYDDRRALVAMLADAEPVHPPGEGVAEHGLTYGHLLDEILRRATGTSIGTHWRRFATTRGWDDLHLRVRGTERHRVADVVGLGDWPSAYLDDPRWAPVLTRPPGLLDPSVVNSDRFRRLSFSAVNLHTSARALAGFYAGLTDPAGPVADLLGPELHRAYLEPAASGFDLVLGREVTWTLGLQRDDGSDGGEDGELGMGGAGGSAGWWSPRGEHGAAYVTRGLGTHDRSTAVWEVVEGR